MSDGIVIHIEEPKPAPVPTVVDLCVMGAHRWAWRNDGQQECYFCGRVR